MISDMIGFAGLSHLGIVSSIATAANGFEVLAYDSDAGLVKALDRGDLPIFEPDLEALLEDNRTRIWFTADSAELASCNVLFVSVDVPTDENNCSDLSTLQHLIDTVTDAAPPGCVVVVLSQVPPGFMRKLAHTLTGHDLHVYYQVETLIFGRAVGRALHPERFIVGCSDPETALPKPFAELLAASDCPVLRMRYESAELAKISINMCLVASIATANTLAELCEAIGADWSEIVPALKLDRRIGEHAYLAPGLGIAGGNLERDLMTVRSLAGEFGADAGVVDAWLINSRHRRDWVLRIIFQEVMVRVQKPVIGVWGLTYKPDTASTRNSPALTLIEALGPPAVQAYDPQAELDPAAFPDFVRSSSALEACHKADVLAIMTPWPEFSSIDLTQLADEMAGRVIADPFGVLDRKQCSDLGFRRFELGLSMGNGGD